MRTSTGSRPRLLCGSSENLCPADFGAANGSPHGQGAEEFPDIISAQPAPKQPVRQPSQSAEAVRAALPQPTNAQPTPDAPAPAPRRAAFALRLEPQPEPPSGKPQPTSAPPAEPPKPPKPRETPAQALEQPASERRAAPQPAAEPKSDTQTRDPLPSKPIDRPEPDHRRAAPPQEPPSQPSAPQPSASPAAPEPRHHTEQRPAPPAAEPHSRAAAHIETAELDRRRDDQTHFRLVLRDDRLGRVSLNLTERAGLIDLMVRADRPATVRALQDSLPALVDSLAQRNFRAESTVFAPSSGLAQQRDASEERERRERRAHEPKPRLRARRVAGAFAASAE